MIAAQHLGFGSDACLQSTIQTTRAYRKAMAEYTRMGYLEVWNRLLTVEELRIQTGITRASLADRIQRFEGFSDEQVSATRRRHRVGQHALRE
ncbi:DUF2252 family protein [Ilumatobacter sp.]|uniref:DUF2252 family protein n=1 Tax=Ilumatobacter sp. TaxID=1967498 RepID=UPI003C5A8C28